MKKGKRGTKVVKGKGGSKAAMRASIRYEATDYRAMFVQGQKVIWKGTSEHDPIKETIFDRDKEKAVQALILRVLKQTGWKQMPTAGSRDEVEASAPAKSSSAGVGKKTAAVEAEASAPAKRSSAGAGNKRAAPAGKTDDLMPKAALAFCSSCHLVT